MEGEGKLVIQDFGLTIWKLLLTEERKIAGQAGLYIKSSVWGILSLKCPLDIQVEMLSTRQLDLLREVRLEI